MPTLKLIPSKALTGFTLIELLVVISIIGLLASIVLIALKDTRQKGNDARRVADMKQLVTALNLYYDDNNAYPPINGPSSGAGGWNVSYNPGFLQELVNGKLISTNPKDPINLYSGGSLFVNEGRYYYAYYNYPAASAANYGCPFKTDFAVLAITTLEKGKKPETPKAQCGTFSGGVCAGGGVPGVCRDWSAEFDYSVILVK